MKNSPSDSVFATCFTLVLFIGKAYVGWSVVFLLLLQHSATLCLCLLQLWHFPVNFPCNTPNSIGAYPDLLLYKSTKTCYLCYLFYAYNWPTIANVDLSSSATCNAAFKFQGFYIHTHTYVVDLRLSRNQNNTSCESKLAY